MINYQQLPAEKSVFVFELDDVIYPKREYLIQVYYLFANFLEFTDGKPLQADLVKFFINHLDKKGEELIFQHAQEAFGFDQNYLENFERLLVNAVLPTKLLMSEGVEELLNAIIQHDKRICILTKGNPLMQLNKIKHIQWGILASHLKLYFVDELEFRQIDPLEFIAEELEVAKKSIVYFETSLSI